MFRFVCCLASLFLASTLFAQDTASLRGIVRDPSGAVIRGARVTLTNADKKSEQNSRSNGEGVYTFPFVLAGTYNLTIEAAGFKKYERPNLVLDTAQKGAADVQLTIGGPQESVVVSGSGLLLNENDGSVGAVIDRALVENVPLNGRSLQALFTLVPGVTQVATGNYPDTTDGTIIVNGQRAQSNQFSVDGVSANVSAGKGPTVSPNVPTMNALGGTQSLATIDELQEFKVLTSTYSAEYGTSPGGQFLLTTRSGNNHLHGSAYEFLRNEALNANDWFSNNRGTPRGKLRQNLFGGSFGGPVVLPHIYNGHEKTFFFTSFEGLQLVTPITQVMNVPNQTLRNTAYSALQPVLNSFPAPEKDLGNGIGTYTLSASQPSSIYTGAGRLDHVFSSKLQAFARYTRSPSDTSGLSTNTVFANTYTKIWSQAFTAGLTWVPTSHLGNELRFNWTTTDSRSGMQARLGQVDLFSFLSRSADNPSDSYATLAFRLPSGNITLQQGLSVALNQQVNLIDTFSWALGSHMLKFGGNFRRLNMTASSNSYNGNMQFSSIAAVTSGKATALSITSTAIAKPTFYNFGLFVNDDFRISERLRVQLGLRWDVNPAPGETNGLSPTAYSGGPDFETITARPAGTALFKTKYFNLAPRAGLAYRLGQLNGQPTVLRLGAGIFFDTNDAQGAAPYSSYPFGNSVSYSNIQFPFSSTVTAPPSASVPVEAPYGNIYAVDSGLHLPVTYSWSAALEQALGQRSSVAVTYVGNATRQMLQSFYMNYVADAKSVQYTKNGSNANYNALQVQYQARLMHGMTAFGGYTWSHAIDDTDLQQNTYSVVPVRGDSDGDQRHVARLGLSYTGPDYHHGSRVTKLLLGNWGGDLNLWMQSALPLTLRAGYTYFPGGNYQYDRPNVVPGVRQWIENPKAPGGWQLNRDAFTAPPYDPVTFYTTMGNLGRNSLRGFATGQADIALRKGFAMTEALTLQFRAETFNLTNHPNFGSFNTSYSATTTTLGQATAMYGTALGGLNPLYQTGGPRSMQFALKLLF